MLPDQPWHVHDPARPHPRLVTPAATPGAPPSDAIVLFDGKDLSQWTQDGRGERKGKLVDAQWKLGDGYFEVVHNTGNLRTREAFGDDERPGAHAGGGAPHARERPVGDVERLHDGGHRGALHRATTSTPTASCRMVGEERVVSVALVGDAMARPLAEALAAAPPGTYDTSSLAGDRLRRGHAVAAVKADLAAQLPGGDDHGPLRIERGRRPGRGGGRCQRPEVRDERRHGGPRRRPPAAGPGRRTDRAAGPVGSHPARLLQGRGQDGGHLPDRPRRGPLVGPRRPGLDRRPTGSSPCTAAGRPRSTRAARRSSPRRSRRRSRPTPTCTTPSWSACPTSGSASGWPPWSAARRAPPAHLEALQEHCRAHIAGYKVPRQLLLVDEIPLTAAGKPDAKAAKALF